jgi:uncharacterized protein YydD (DUF2326 family)
MKLRKDFMQEIVAGKASGFVSTARRIENERHQLKKDKRKGVPQEMRTDSFSSAYKNNGTLEDFTAHYEELIAHYGYIATRNKRIENKFKEEQRRLQTLPACKSVNYSQEYVRVTRTSAINIKRVYLVSAQMQQPQEANQAYKLQGMLNKLEIKEWQPVKFLDAL